MTEKGRKVMKKRFGMLKKAIAVGCAMAMLGSVGAVANGTVVYANEPDQLGEEEPVEPPQETFDSNFNQDVTEINASTDDTAEIYLIKKYTSEGDTAISPAEDFIFTITPLKAWNTEEGATIPALGQTGDAESPNAVTIDADNVTTVKIHADKGAANEDGKLMKQKLTLPTYPSVGDYWYTVKETTTNHAGKSYTTNATSNNNEYYIHVQVLNKRTTETDGTETNSIVRLVTMHLEKPDTSDTNAKYNTKYKDSNKTAAKDGKVQEIDNSYKAGSLSVTKK